MHLERIPVLNGMIRQDSSQVTLEHGPEKPPVLLALTQY